MKACELRLSHGRSRYLEAGTGRPVILLHGVNFLDSGESWLLNIEALAERFWVLAPDLLGWGPGDQLDLGYSFAYLVDFLREFQDALGIRRSHIVGHSMGGWVASLLAYESPHRVDRLVLVAPGGLASRPLASMTSWSPPGPAEIWERAEKFRRNGVDPATMVEEQIERARDVQRVERHRRVLQHMSNPETRERYNTIRRLPHIVSPTLIVWGEEDNVNDVGLASVACELIPDSRLELLAGIGHGPATECPDQFNQIVSGFLDA